MGKKIKDESLEKILGDENQSAMKDFEMTAPFLFISQTSAEMLTI